MNVYIDCILIFSENQRAAMLILLSCTYYRSLTIVQCCFFGLPQFHDKDYYRGKGFSFILESVVPSFELSRL